MNKSDDIIMKYTVLLALVALVAGTEARRALFGGKQCGPKSLHLPDRIRPEHYELLIKPNAESMTSEGSVDIHLNVIESAKGWFKSLSSKVSANQIALNAAQDFVEIDESTIKYTDTNGKSIKVTGSCHDKDFGIFVVTLEKNLEAGSKGVLHLNFKTKIQSITRGLFRDDSYSGDGKMIPQIVTQNEPSLAREIFPCFDQPDMKATFKLSIVHPAHEKALSNTEAISSEKAPDDDSKMITHFDKTPIMSTYIVAFAIGQYDVVEKTIFDGKVKVRINAPPGRGHEAEQALEISVKGMELMRDYFGIDYPLNKVDFVTAPSFHWGGMENFGLILCNDKFVLTSDDPKDVIHHKGVVAIIHELVHQWLGNMVTAKWWRDLWLNEGLTTWFGYYFAQEIYPDAEIRLDRRIGTNMDVMVDDIYSRVRRAKIESTDDIEETFDGIMYNKGSTITRMLRDYVGHDNFKAAIREYIQTYTYKNTEVPDLVAILDKHSKGLNIAKFIDDWLDRKGHPLLIVDYDKNKNSLNVHQHRFPRKGKIDGHWIMPVSVLVSDGADENEIVKFNLEKTADTIELPSWFDAKKPGHFIKVNPEVVGFYNVAYSNDLFSLLVEAIKNKKLSLFDRMDLLKSIYTLNSRNTIDYIQISNLFEALANEEDALILQHMLQIAEAPEERAIVDTLLDRFVEKIGFDVPENYGPFHEDAVAYLLEYLIVRKKNPILIQKALSLFDKDATKLSLALRDPVYLAVAIEGSDEQFEKLLEHAQTSKYYNEKNRAYKALAQASSERSKQVLEALTNDPVPFSEKSERIESIKV